MPEERKPKICPLKRSASLAAADVDYELWVIQCTSDCAWYDESEDIEGGCVMVAIAEHLKEIWSRMPQI